MRTLMYMRLILMGRQFSTGYKLTLWWLIFALLPHCSRSWMMRALCRL